MYSIKSISVLTGLGVETLRAWERRYQVIAPRREAGGHRTYSQQDLEKLTLLACLTRQGHAISKVSSLDIEQLQKLASGAEEQVEQKNQFSEQIVEALLHYRIDRCEQLLKRALISSEPLIYVRDILAPALVHVGQLWHEGKINIAQEHIFSASVKRILLSMVNNVHNLSANRASMLFATPSGEPHEFGLLMSSLLAAEQQYNCYYLGADVPAFDIVEATKKLEVNIVVLSLLKSPSDPETLVQLNAVMEALSQTEVTIWLAGRGVSCWLSQKPMVPSNCDLIADFDDFHNKALQWRHHN